MDTNGNIKKLLIKDLSSRLPYNVICQVEFKENGKYNSKVMLLSGIFTDEAYFTTKGGSIYSNEYKPYLFPLSTMTKEQKTECLKGTSLEISKYDEIYGYSEYTDLECYLKVIDWLNAHHFDFRGLIEKGLAIDATGLNIY